MPIKCHFSHILLLKASRKASPSSTGREIDSTFWGEQYVHTLIGEAFAGHPCTLTVMAPRVFFVTISIHKFEFTYDSSHATLFNLSKNL